MDKSILEGKVRNIDIEEYAIDMIVKKTGGYISHDEIKETLRNNGFDGVYVVTPQEFHEVEDDPYAVGLYSHDCRVVLLDGEAYAKQPDIAIHEVIHAYLGRRGCSLVEVDNSKVNYGYGLEEGFAALMQKCDDINDIDNCNVNSYPYQAIIFKQLNVLYQYSDCKKYPSLLHLMLKEPESFLHTLSQIYASILRKFVVNYDFISMTSMKTAFAAVSSSDAMVSSDGCQSVEMTKIISSFNTIYLALASKNFRDGVEQHKLFPDLHMIAKTAEERLLGTIFNDESNYILKQLSNLNLVMILHTEEMERLNKEDKNVNSKVKSR